MNYTTFNTTFSSCDSSESICNVNRTNISSDVRAVFIARIVVNALTCPLSIVLNMLVMVAVKSKRQLRTKSNIALACLATTDLVVGLVVQPLHITASSLLLKGERMFCTVSDLLESPTTACLLASLLHVVLISAERYVAKKHPFKHEIQVTEFRIIMASALAWAAAIILSNVGRPNMAIVIVSETLLIILPAYFNVSVYKEVRRNKKQIADNQVSLEAKEKLLKKRKAFYTTVIVLLVILMCYIPTNICAFIVISLNERIPSNAKVTALNAFALFPILNSLFNPLIYAIRIRDFRVAFIQLLSRKNEMKIFGPRQIRVNDNVNPGQGNQALNGEREITRQAEPHTG